MVSFDLFLTETLNFADIVLPDCSDLQSLDLRSNFPFIFSLPAGMGEGCWPIRQPLLPPDGEQRYCADVLLEIADRVGFRARPQRRLIKERGGFTLHPELGTGPSVYYLPA